MNQETTKQETLEKAANIYANNLDDGIEQKLVSKIDFMAGAKWHEKRSYSEDEVMDILYKHTEDLFAGKRLMLDEWFNQFKKK